MRSRGRAETAVLLRPLLGIAKARLVVTLHGKGVAFVEDPSNRDARFERVRWRQAMPGFAESGLSAARLGILATRMGRMEEALDSRALEVRAMVDAGSAEDVVRLAFSRLALEPAEIGLRVLSLALRQTAPDGDGLRRLEREEACFEALRKALPDGAAMTRTLSGCLISLSRDGMLAIRRETGRRRGVHPVS